jgi:hypothetical protein
MPRRPFAPLLLVLTTLGALGTGCEARQGEAGAKPAPAPAAAAASGPSEQPPGGATARRGAAPASPGVATADSLARAASPAIRALYVNRFAAQSTRRMRELVALADSTEINALVIDQKDEFGLSVSLERPELARNGGTAPKQRDVRALTDTLRAHGILPIARIVVFKDSVAARLNPSWTIRKADGSIWRDHKGLAWVDPFNREVWEYNLAVAEELVGLGFGEIQFDYIRFPEPYKSLPAQVFPSQKGQSKPDAIAEFLKVANARLDKLGVRATADIFGLVTTVGGPLEVAQHWERLSPVTDVLLPMVYPSHYPRGSLGVAHPNGQPYQIVFKAIDRARERDAALGITGRENVRPWLKLSASGNPTTGPRRSGSRSGRSTTRATTAGCSGTRAPSTRPSWARWSAVRSCRGRRVVPTRPPRAHPLSSARAASAVARSRRTASPAGRSPPRMRREPRGRDEHRCPRCALPLATQCHHT